jgi:hypothetical protein
MSGRESTGRESNNLSRQAMHSYCEPYFHAIKEWTKYNDRNIFKNRLQLVATLVKILNEQNSSSVYELEVDNLEVSLMPSIHPNAGREYQPGIKHIFIYICILYLHISICVKYVYVQVYEVIHVITYICIYIVYTHLWKYIFIYINMYICVYTYIYIYVCICI